MNFSSLINQIAKRLPDKTAVIENGASITYSELWDKIEAIANSLCDIELKEGGKVALVLPNCKEFIYSFFAILRANIIAIPLNPHLTASELKKIFDNSKPDALISDSATICKILAKDESLLQDKIVISLDAISLDNVNKIAKSFLTMDQLYQPKRHLSIQKLVTKNDQIASINYTYRGYGYPLGAMLTHGNYIHGAVGYIRLVKPTLEQRFLLMMPISHIFTLIGCVVVPLLRGATVVILKTAIPRHIFNAIQHYKIDFLVSVPTLFQVLLKNYDSSKHDITSLKYGISGGAPIDAALYNEIRNKMKFEVLQGYGLTETMPIICNPKERVKPGALGVPGHEVKVKIINKSGSEVKVGEKGDILIGGPTVMKGYYNHQRETREALKNGWIHTGDIGRLDESGYLYFEGLDKGIVKVGGNTVDLLEVKNVLSSHPDVSDVRVYAKKNDLWGNIIEAEVCLRKNTNLSEREIQKFCSKNLAIYKVPRKISIEK